ncbi:phenylacetate-CoA ligase [Natranaerovirga hydrolytica]|uniref:Phenylacetate-coenzyme A ligase n=1 Tax=Natranaerovirga hydrolytica TaxID=680378 RepID=A0A4R1MX53_9FIRM|nr:phenylacetate--CoA ligase [Natranaerovirga hydrolytica]TCK97838.1 phenylacetate-CoA ligase [Natranaerovirga hydrolytica]
MIWAREEILTRSEIINIQNKGLKDTLNRIYNNVPYYKEKMKAKKITPKDIETIIDLKNLPFTEKDDLRKNYPFGLFTVKKDELIRIHASSGTTGKPTVVGYTRKDLETWSELIARLVTMAGATQKDVAQIAFGYGLFTGAFGLHYGLEKIGALVVPSSSGNTEKQIMLMKDFGTTILVSTPSYALHMAEVAKKIGVNPKEDLNLKMGLFGGEGSTEAMRNEIQNAWGILATENYGMSELIGPGVSGECTHLCGMHICEDHFIPEIIDPDTKEVLPEGEEGELVITTITKEALPLIRYRTKDITSLTYEPCACGRTTVRMAKIQGRTDDMLIVRGVNVFPSQIEDVLLKMKEIGPHYEIVLKKRGYLDFMEIKVELADESLLESYSALERLEKKIKHQLQVILGVDAIIKLVEPKTLQRFVGKAKRITDLRNEGGNQIG